MKFSLVAQTFQAIEQQSSRLEMTRQFAQLCEHATPEQASIISYLALGLLFPPYIGTQFQFAGKSIAKVVQELLNVDAAFVDQGIQKLGDVGSLVAQGSWQQTAEHETLSVQQVYNQLGAFLAISGTGSQDAKAEALLKLLRQVDPLSAKFIIRIVLGTLRLGFSDMTLLDAFSWMEVGDKSLRAVLENAYNICADIGLIIKILKSQGVDALAGMTIKPGIPIRPSAAERLPNAAAIIAKLGPCIAQPKLDGFRLQVHVDARSEHSVKMCFFSRNLQDMSAMFPDLQQSLASLKVKTFVAEGEAICFDQNTGNFLPFQETVKRKRKHDIGATAVDFPLKLFLFDILYLDGVSLLDRPHDERRKILCDIIPSHDPVISVIEERKVTTPQELETYFHECMQSGLEGLVVKRPDAIYQPGKRNFNWIKLKNENSEVLDDTIDCVIVGYNYGKGKRAKFGIGAFLVAVYNKKQDIFQTVAKIGSGLTDEEWVTAKEQCDKFKSQHQPKNVECSKVLFPDVWVDPIIVCVVRADQVTLSPLHKAGSSDSERGIALRFPRIMGFRPDKSALDATSVDEVEHLYRMQHKK